MNVKMPFGKSSRTQEKAQAKRQSNELQRMLRQSTAFRTRRANITRKLCLILLVVDLLTAPVYLVMAFIVSSIYFILIIPVLFSAVALVAAFFCATSGSEIRLKVASYLLMIFLLIDGIVCQWEYGATSAALLLYPFTIIVGALIGLEIIEITAVTLVSAILTITMTVLALGVKAYTPLLVSEKDLGAQFFLQALMLLVILGGVISLLHSLYQALGESEQRAHQFIEANHSLTQTALFGKDVTYSLSSIVNELSATSRQQAGGAQEQAAAVMEVTTSLTELGETARQIAGNSSMVSAAANAGLTSASGVREATARANTTAERGQTAVDSSIQAIEDVRNGITALAERLMTLTERSRQISSIIGLIKEIADETHLLALNAAIESAGSGQNGRRFAVVASEVKSLADRSLEATSEVTEVISELQGAVAAAVLASEETRKKTFGAVERSYQAGQVITELGQVVDETAISSTQILEAVAQVATLAEEIRLATQQQESAVQQIISTMDGVGTVAQENASAVSQVSETINRIDDLSTQLKQVFASSNLIAA